MDSWGFFLAMDCQCSTWRFPCNPTRPALGLAMVPPSPSSDCHCMFLLQKTTAMWRYFFVYPSTNKDGFFQSLTIDVIGYDGYTKWLITHHKWLTIYDWLVWRHLSDLSPAHGESLQRKKLKMDLHSTWRRHGIGSWAAKNRSSPWTKVYMYRYVANPPYSLVCRMGFNGK